MTTHKNRKKTIFAILLICIVTLTACDIFPVQTTPEATFGTPQITATPTVTVQPTASPTPASNINALETVVQLYQGELLDVSQYFVSDSTQITYSLNNNVAKLVGSILTAVNEGECTVTASVGDASASVTVQILPLPDKKVSFDAGEFIALPVGQSAKMVYSVHTMYQNKVVLQSQGECIDFSDGIVTALEKGVGSIVATVDGKYAGRCNVVVSTTEPVAPLSGITQPQYTFNDGVLTSDSTSGDSAVIMLTGDIMCLSAQQNAVKKNGKYDFSPSFKYIKPYFDQADFVMGNLETIVSVSYPYANQQKNMDGKPNCNGPSTILDALRYAGYDALATANNHSLDAGHHGLLETLERLEFYRMPSTGTFGENQKRYIIAQINGIKVAFMSYTDIMNKRTSVSTEVYSQIIGEYSKQNLQRDCQNAKNDGAEFIIAYMHWGKENTHELTTKQKNYAKEMAEAGVDVIAGSHPHCLQPAEYITASDGSKTLCLYSMGNFVSSMSRDINNDTAVFRLELEKKDGQVQLKNAGYLPCRVTGYEDARFVILPCDMDSSTASKNARARIDALLETTLDKLTYTV